MAAIYGSNYGRPTLDINFAKNKSLIDTISGQNLVSFGRGSIGTYVGADGLIKTAVANEPRFDHDPVTGVCNGLLVEEARTNLLTYSEQFDNAAWQKSNSSVTTNATIAPDGATTGDSLVDNTVNNSHPVYRTVSSLVNATTYTFSIFLKAGSRSKLRIVMSNTAFPAVPIASIDLVAVTITATGGGITTITSAGNGWYRCILTATSGASGNCDIYIEPRNDAGSVTYVGTGSDAIYLWGAQLEVGSFPTSYIPTTTATVTRSVDQASISGTNFSRWYNSSEGTVLFDSALNESTNATVSLVFGNYLWATNPQVWRTTGNAAIIFPTSSSRTTRTKHAFALKANDHAVSINGGAVLAASLNNNTSPASSGPVSFNVNAPTLNGYINRIIYYPTRLQNSQLQQLTK